MSSPMPMADYLLRNALAADPVDIPTVAWVHEQLLEEVAGLRREKTQLLQANKKLEEEKEGLKAKLRTWVKKAEGQPHTSADLRWAKEEIQKLRNRTKLLLEYRETHPNEDWAYREENEALRGENETLQKSAKRLMERVLEQGKRFRLEKGGLAVG